MKNSKLAVIVTVYNREEYLERCIDSIINQTYKNLEIILVDDGSTDSSYQIMKKYAEIDSRLRIFHKENGGIVSCWKYGLKQVKSPYLTMVDSDDWLPLDAFEKMMIKSLEYDVDMLVGAASSDTKNDIESCIFDGYYSGDRLITLQKNMLNRRKTKSTSISRWAKIFKTDFYRKTLDCNYHENVLEDLIFIVPLYFAANSIYFLNEPCYYYFYNQNSMTNKKYRIGEFEDYNLVIKTFLTLDFDKNNIANKYDICGYFLYIKIAMLLFSDLTKSEKVVELRKLMKLKYTKRTISCYKKIGFEKTVLKILLSLKFYWLIVYLKGTK